MLGLTGIHGNRKTQIGGIPANILKFNADRGTTTLLVVMARMHLIVPKIVKSSRTTN